MGRDTNAGDALGRIAINLIHLPGSVRALSQRFGFGSLHLMALRRVVMFPELGLAYNRIKKNANTSVVMLLRELENGQVEDRDDAKWLVRSVLDLSAAERRHVRDLHFFVVIRDPYSRVLSAFLDRFRHPHYQKRHGPFALTPAGFGEFVHWLAQGGMDKDGHWDLQVKLLLVPLEKFDTVIRFESFREQTLAMLVARGLKPRQGSLEDLYSSDQDKKTSALDRMRGFYTPELRDIVARLYARDFRELGYSTEFDPGAPPAA